jgi:hypothetical protein
MEEAAMTTKSEKVPKEMEPKVASIVKMTDEFCKNHLNDEYAQLSRYVAAALARKRPSPLAKGKEKSWACGILYALGFVNFLSDKSTEPHMSMTELCDAFGVSKSSGGNYSKKVRDALDLVQMDPNWCLPSLMDENPLAWSITINGFMVDARTQPRHIQEIAFKKGLIPYIPED